MGEFTTIMARDGHEFQAYLSAPPGKPQGAIVVIQEIFGVNAHIRAVTDGFAQEGYTVIAPAMFDRIRRGIELGYSQPDREEGSGYMKQLKLDETLTPWLARQRTLEFFQPQPDRKEGLNPCI